MKAEFPVPQAAPVLNVVSPPMCSVSLSSSVAGEILGCHPEGLKQLEMPFLLWGSQEGPLPGASGDSWTPCQTQQTLADPAARLQARESVQCKRLDFSFCFHSCQKPTEQEVGRWCQGRCLHPCSPRLASLPTISLGGS